MILNGGMINKNFFTFNYPHNFYLNNEINPYSMLSKLCPRCRQIRVLNYFCKNDGTGWHTICKECRDALFKNQPPSIILYNSNDKEVNAYAMQNFSGNIPEISRK